ncbi:MAG: sigma-24 (FecI-like) [Proteobacteria bacterium]|nr:sigma-24 (FecI-like) [Pseudomonadota bacterium]
MNPTNAAPCLLRAWEAHERGLRGWLIHQVHDKAIAEDLLQDVFLKALRQGERFCSIENARAWLFEVSRNTLADHLRRTRETVALPEDMSIEDEVSPPVDGLTACLPRVLAELSPADREAIIRCDIEGMSQAEFAERLGISLPGAKSRVQRARLRLKAQLASACQVSFDEQGKVCCFKPRAPLPEGEAGDAAEGKCTGEITGPARAG